MKNLDCYKKRFDSEYPDYADSQYQSIKDLISALPSQHDAEIIFSSNEAIQAISFLVPLIKIKNYKSQIPFPTDVQKAIKFLIKVKNSTPLDLTNKLKFIFMEGLALEGFQLPTLSAILHFCHPNDFPIVDRNIEASCNSIKNDLNGVSLKVPSLPAQNTSLDNKVQKYNEFVVFLSKVRDLHNTEYKTSYSFRDLDKALMVYGSEVLKKK